MPKLQIEISPYIESMVKELTAITGRSKTFTVEDLLFRVETLLRHNKLPETFGLDVIEAAGLVNARGLGAKHLDPVHQDGGLHVAFDVELLEKSSKAKTGFAGVYATTSGSFRALVPDVEQGNGSRYLDSRPTALRAAIDRFEWFEKYAIPYGNVGRHVTHYMNTKGHDIDEALRELRMLLSGGPVEGLRWPVTLEEVDALIERRIGLHYGKQPEEFPSAGKASTPAISEPVICAVCDEAIKDGSSMGPHGKTGWAHSHCQPRD